MLGGGRYDGLSEMLGGPHLPSVGFAAGIERLALLGDDVPLEATDVIMIVMDKELEAEGFALATKIREAGLSVDIPFSGNISKKLKRADKIGARHAVLLGSQEFNNQEVQVKSMQTGETITLSLDALVTSLTEM